MQRALFGSKSHVIPDFLRTQMAAFRRISAFAGSRDANTQHSGDPAMINTKQNRAPNTSARACDKRRRQGRRRHADRRSLRFESLDPRRMLAADLGIYVTPDVATSVEESELAEEVQLASEQSPQTSLGDPNDVNNDGSLSPIDLLLLLDDMSRDGSRKLSDAPEGEGGERRSYLDINGDGYFSPIDILQVINALNREDQAIGDPASAPPAESPVRMGSHHPYDINHDDIISPVDVLAIINYTRDHADDSPPDFGAFDYDVNHDGIVSKADIEQIVDYLDVESPRSDFDSLERSDDELPPLQDVADWRELVDSYYAELT